MSDELSNLLTQFQRNLENVKNVATARSALSSLLPHQPGYAKNPNDYNLNRAIGIFLAGSAETLAHAEPFLIKAVNENRDDEHRPKLLESMARVFDAGGDIERACLVLREAAQFTPSLYRDLAHALLRLGDEKSASEIYNTILEILDELAVEKARELGREITQLLWPNRVTCSRFGELSHAVDVYIKARKLGLTPKVKAILTTRSEWVCNKVLLEYWHEQHPGEITILTDPVDVAEMEETYERCELDMHIFRLADDRVLHTNWASPEIWALWEDAGGGPLLKLRDDHRQKGADWLQQRGMPKDAWFAALHVREPGYHAETGSTWDDNQHRDGRIEDYLQTIKAITDRGGWVVRIGDPSMTPLPDMAQVIDYAVSTDRAEELDIFFCAAAKFMVAVSSGGLAVANVFGTPIVGVNMFPPGDPPFSHRDLYIPKLFRRRDTGKYLNAAEMVAPPRRLMQSPRYYEEHGLEVISNTPEEIREAVEEMMARLNGEFHMTDDDQENIRRFRDLNDYRGIRIASAPTASFLRRYPHLVE